MTFDTVDTVDTVDTESLPVDDLHVVEPSTPSKPCTLYVQWSRGRPSA